MGFFKDILDATPNRTVALEIKDYCSNVRLSDREEKLSEEHGINRQQLIWLRNSYNFCVFQAFLTAMIDKYPNSYFSITQSFLNGIITDVFYSKAAIAMLDELNVPLPSSYGLWSDYFNDYCERIEIHNNLNLNGQAKLQMEQLTTAYQNEVAEFIKKRESKLKKPL